MARRDDLTPEQHEARIAELRARRRARMAVLARRSAFIGVGLFLLFVVLLAWLLQTVAGRDVLLNQIVSRLPAGTTLTWTSAEGPAAGPLTLRGVHFSMPRQIDPACVPTDTASCEMSRIVFDAQTVVLDPALRPLLGKRLRLDALVVQGATLSLPRSDTPFELPRWPESLPDIAPPLALQADDIRIDDLAIRQDAQPLIAIASARGGLDASDGRLHVEHLVVESDRGRFTAHGNYAPRDDYRSDLTLSAALPAPPLRTAPRIGVVLRGDLSRMLVAVSGHAPAPVDALLVLRDDTRSERPRWSLRARSEALDPSLLSGSGEASEPLSFDFKAGGLGGRARLQGEFARGDFAVVVQPSRLRLEDQVLELRPLVVDLLDGRVVARGHVDLRRDAPNAAGDESPIRLALQARDLRWIGSTPEVPAIVLDADVGVAGTPNLWAAIGNATFQRGVQQASVRFDGLGNRSDVEVRKLHAATSNGALDATGRLQWAPSLAWNGEATLGGFDPGYFLPDWPGAVTGHATTSGETLANGDLALRFDADRLGGRLRGRALGGHGKLTMLLPADANAAPRYEGDVDLRLGDSRVEAGGTVADRLDVRARFEPLRLDDLLPNAGGVLRGTLALAGARNAPDITADLDGSGLRYDDWAAESLHAQGRLPWRTGSGSLVLDANGLDAGIPVNSIHVDATGAVERLQLQATAGSEYGDLALAGNTTRRNGRWQGTLDTLQLDPWRGSAWSLQSPTTFAQTGNGWRLDDTCLAAADGGTLCASGDWPRQGLHAEGRGLPLTLATPYLPERSDGRPWLLHGEIALDLEVRRTGSSWRGEGSVVSAVGGLKNSARSRNDLVGYRDLVLVAHFDPERIQASVNAGLNGEGRLVGRIDAGWDAYAPLEGEVALDTSELTWMELLSPDIVEPTGTLAGHIALGGTRAQPTLGGNAQLTDFATELPALAIAPSEGNVRLDALPDGTAHIAGRIKSGDGVLRIDGSLGWSGEDTPLVLNVRGENVLASDTRDLRMVVAPDVVVRYAARQPLDIRGSVQVPSARIDLERLDSGVSVSDDVVVLDPEDPEEGLATPVQVDLTVALGEDVRLNGFGLEGSLGGSLRVVARPGREMLATGTLDVGGRYKAYGQELEISRGRLVWQGSPIADPLLDIRAEREVGDVTAGIDVGGRATRPTAEVWTDPATDQSEALAYLALGRPLATVTGDESRQLDAASAALSAGTGLLASQLGAKIGLDDAGVSQSRALGGSVLGVGKYLSPKLYVGYGVSLLGTGQVLTLKYLLRKGFDIEIESSTIENRASVNWRKER